MYKFQKIFVEEEIYQHERTQHILQSSTLKNIPITTISKIEDIFGRVRKPYLHKREDLNLFIGQKKGIKFYNDSFSTTPETAIAAINSFNEKEILILGGSKKKSDFSVL